MTSPPSQSGEGEQIVDTRVAVRTGAGRRLVAGGPPAHARVADAEVAEEGHQLGVPRREAAAGHTGIVGALGACLKAETDEVGGGSRDRAGTCRSSG